MRGVIQLFGQLLTPAARKFHTALDDPHTAQRQIQERICDRLIQSEYGKSLGIQSVQDWQQVPIVEYDDLKPWIVSSDRGFPQKSLLTPEPILFYERTSGSRSAAKQIPYTKSLRRSFNHLFCVWAHDLIRNGPAFSTGKVYFCISPQFGGQESGLQDDSAYLDHWLRLFLAPFLVGINQANSPEDFKRRLCLALLQAERLETISIWSPSFLTLLLNYIQSHKQELRQELRISAERDHLLAQSNICWTEVWPELKLISCWDSANAADSADSLRSQFPSVLVQGKGLLATEAPMTVPLIAAAGQVPLLDQVFFEFEDENETIHLLHELQIGQSYTLILSQQGGLYRYRIGDRVHVTHYYRNTPCLEFLGREGAISDLVGEKLHEAFVREALQQLQLQAVSFQTLVPVTQPQPHYVLLLDHMQGEVDAIAQQLDQILCQSPHYDQARQLDQLAPLCIWTSPKTPEILVQAQLETGKKWGDIKHPLLASKAIGATLVAKLNLVNP